MNRPKIAVIGSAGMGIYLAADHFHGDGETLEALDMHAEPGGKGFNQAVAAKRYGADVSFLAAVGNDAYGDECQIFLEKEGIDSHMVRNPGKTTFAVILTDKRGQNQVTYYSEARLTPNDVKLFETYIADADILLLQNEVSDEINITAIELAQKHGIAILYNPAPGRTLPSALLREDILYTPNEHEARFLPEHLQNVVVTLGAKGCLIKSTGQIIPTTSVKPKNTTGAGDTFSGVLAAALATGLRLPDACMLANQAASVSVTRDYAVSSIPFRLEY